MWDICIIIYTYTLYTIIYIIYSMYYIFINSYQSYSLITHFVHIYINKKMYNSDNNKNNEKNVSPITRRRRIINPPQHDYEEKTKETMYLLDQLCKQSSSAYLDLGKANNDLTTHFKSNTLRSPLKTSSQLAKQRRRSVSTNNLTQRRRRKEKNNHQTSTSINSNNNNNNAETISFMDKNHNGISVKRIVSGRQHMYVSNLMGFEVFTTKENKDELDKAAYSLINIEQEPDIENVSIMWEIIQKFFNSIPLIHFDTDNLDGRARFARYVQTMETLKEIIRKMVFENYKPGIDDTNKLTPYFLACRIAENDIKNLENEIEALESKLQQSVGTTKEEIINAFKNIGVEEQAGLRQYFVKDGTFAYPKTPPINTTRHYGENRPFDKEFNNMVVKEDRRKAEMARRPNNIVVKQDASKDSAKAAARWMGGLKVLKAKDEMLYLQNEMEDLQLQYTELQTKYDESQRQLKLAKHEAAVTKSKLQRASKNVIGNRINLLKSNIKSAHVIGKVILTKDEHVSLKETANQFALVEKENENLTSRIKMLEKNQDDFITQLSELLNVKYSRSVEIEDAIIQQIQTLLGSHENLRIQVKELELNATTRGISSDRNETTNNTTSNKKTPRVLRNLLQKAMLTTMKRNKAIKMFQISPTQSKAIKEKRHYEKASKDYINNHDLVVTTNTPFYNIVKSLPGGITSGISNDRKIARLISNIYADKIIMDFNFDKIAREHLSLPQFLKTFFIRRCGEKQLALKKLDMLIQSLRHHRQNSKRFDTIAILLGLDAPDVKHYTPLACGFYLHAMYIAIRAIFPEKYKNATVDNRTAPTTSSNNNDNRRPRLVDLESLKQDIKNVLSDGVQAKTYLSRDNVLEICEGVGFTLKETEKLLTAITRKGLWLIDNFLAFILSHWYKKREERHHLNEQLFDRADTNGDGILSIQEFKDIVFIAEPDVQEVDILALYDFISGVDGTIDKEEFATGMHLVHAQIVKNLRNQL